MNRCSELPDLSEQLLKVSVLIPEGEVRLGRAAQYAGRSEKVTHLGAFLLTRTPVTNRQFIRFMNFGPGGRDANGRTYKSLNTVNVSTRIKYDNSSSRFVIKPGYEEHPATGISWFGAKAYAQWVGGRLPREDEWEKAARGGLKNADYAWGDTAPASALCNFGEHVGDTSPVGTYAPNAYGLFDMCGNVSEWCDDLYYDSCQSRASQLGSKTTSHERVVRGGNWSYSEEYLPVWRRDKYWQQVGRTNLGFRVVFDVEAHRESDI